MDYCYLKRSNLDASIERIEKEVVSTKFGISYYKNIVNVFPQWNHILSVFRYISRWTKTNLIPRWVNRLTANGYDFKQK